MNQASFTIQKATLSNGLKNIVKVIGKMSKTNVHTVVELTITDGLLTIIIPGAKLELECQTNSTAKVTLGFFYFTDIIEASKESYVDAFILDNTIKIGLASYNAKTTFFENDSILRSIKLPINYTDYHLLNLDSKGYTIEELRFNNLEFEIHHAKKRLKSNTNKAKNLLSVYGITKKEIEELIDKKIKL